MDTADRPAAAPLPPWLQSRWVLAMAGAAGLVVVAVAVAFLAHERRQLHAKAWAQAELYARVLEDQANRTFSGVEVAVKTLQDSLALQLQSEPPAEQSPLLQQSLQGMPFLRSMSLVDRHGRILASSNPAAIGKTIDRLRLCGLQGATGLGPMLPIRDLEELPPPATSLARPSAVGDAVLPPSTNQLLPLVQALAVPAAPALRGLQDAWLVAGINPDYFGNQYQLILAQTGLKAGMFSYQGQLIAGNRMLQLVPGQQVGQHPLFSKLLAKDERGRTEGQGLDGERELTAYRSARMYPAVLAVAVPTSRIDQGLTEVLQATAMTTAAVLLLLGSLTALAWRSLRSHASAQTDLEVARGSMAAQHAFTDRLFQLSPIPMVVKDMQGRFVRVNQAWSRFTGLEPERVLGRALGQIHPPHLAVPHDMQEQLAMATGEPAAYEAQMLDQNSQPRDVMVRTTPFTGTDGQVAGVIGCLMDISAFREAETRTLEAKTAAERSNAAKSEFLANISHELRTPLQTIIGFSELGSTRARTEARVQGMFSDIHGAGQRMLTLVNNLLDLSRLESTVGVVSPRPENLVPAVNAVFDELQPLIATRGLSLQRPGVLVALWANADVLRLQQVLRNVLANAIRFAPEGSTIEVDWDFSARGEHRLQVRDQGPGIPEDELDTIFGAFVQSSRTKDGAGGTGLGLAICRKIMQAHGGRITAANAPGGGAIFTMAWPAIEPMAERPGEVATPAGVPAATACANTAAEAVANGTR